MNAPGIAVSISSVSLLISAYAYFNPRKAGGAVQWEMVLAEGRNRGSLRHVGSRPAKNLKITVNGAVPTLPIEKKISHPNDLIYFQMYRSFGNPEIVVTIEWKRLRIISKRRIFEV